MFRSTYMQIREYGDKGWQAFLPALMLSDRIDSWLPSGEDIQKAHDQGVFPLSQEDMIGKRSTNRMFRPRAA